MLTGSKVIHYDTQSKCFSTNTHAYYAHCWPIRNTSVKAEALFFLCVFCLFDYLFSSDWKKPQPPPQLGRHRCGSEKTRGCSSAAAALGWGSALPAGPMDNAGASESFYSSRSASIPGRGGAPGALSPTAEPPGTAMPSESRWCTGISRPRRGSRVQPHSPHGSPPGQGAPQPLAGQAAAPAPVTPRTCA